MKEPIDKFQDYWNRNMISNRFPFIFMFLQLIYMADKAYYLFFYPERFFENGYLINSYKNFRERNYYVSEWFVYLRFAIGTLILLLLPFATIKRGKYMVLSVTAILFLYTMLTLDNIFQRRQSFLVLYIMNIIYRTIRYQSFFDNFALCFSYLTEFNGMNPKSYDIFTINSIFVWLFFFIALYLSNLCYRTFFQFWESIRLLMVLKRKTHLAKMEFNSLLKANISECILEHIMPYKEKSPFFSKVEKRSIPHPNSVNNQPLNTNTSPIKPTTTQINISSDSTSSNIIDEQNEPSLGFEASTACETNTMMSLPFTSSFENMTTNKFLKVATENNIILNYSKGPMSLDDLKSIRGVHRRKSVVIGAAIDKGSSRDCALSVEREKKFFDIMDMIAREYNITPVRRFGKVWVSLMGFFSNESNKENTAKTKIDSSNCYFSILFCIDIKKIASELGIKITFALEMNHITAGFVHDHRFDLFGAEIRWVMRMLDSNSNDIIIGDNVMVQTNIKKKQKFDISISFDRKFVSFPWEKDCKDEIFVVHNLSDLYKYLEEERKRKPLTIFTKYYLIISKFDNINLESPLSSMKAIFNQQAVKIRPSDHSGKTLPTNPSLSTSTDFVNTNHSKSTTINRSSTSQFNASLSRIFSSLNFEDLFRHGISSSSNNQGSNIKDSVANIDKSPTKLVNPPAPINSSFIPNNLNTEHDQFEIQQIENEKLLSFLSLIHSLKKGIIDIHLDTNISNRLKGNYDGPHNFISNRTHSHVNSPNSINNFSSAFEILFDFVFPAFSTTLDSEINDPNFVNVRQMLDENNISPNDTIMEDFVSSNKLNSFLSVDENILFKYSLKKKNASSSPSFFSRILSFFGISFISPSAQNSPTDLDHYHDFISTNQEYDTIEKLILSTYFKVFTTSIRNFFPLVNIFDEPNFVQETKTTSIKEAFIYKFFSKLINLFLVKDDNEDEDYQEEQTEENIEMIEEMLGEKIARKKKEEKSKKNIKQVVPLQHQESSQDNIELFHTSDSDFGLRSRSNSKKKASTYSELDSKISNKNTYQLKPNKKSKSLFFFFKIFKTPLIFQYLTAEFVKDLTYEKFIALAYPEINNLSAMAILPVAIRFRSFKILLYTCKFRWYYFLKASDYGEININEDSQPFYAFYSRSFFQVSIRLFIEESWETYFSIMDIIAKSYVYMFYKYISKTKTWLYFTSLFQSFFSLFYTYKPEESSVKPELNRHTNLYCLKEKSFTERSEYKDHDIEIVKKKMPNMHPETPMSNSVYSVLLNWNDYNSIIKSYYTNSFFSKFIEIIIFLSTFYSIKSILFFDATNTSTKETTNISVFVIFYVIYWIISQTLLRTGGFAIILFLHIMIYIFFPATLLSNISENGGIFPIYNESKIYYGDFGGDILFSMFLTFRLPVYLFHHPSLILLDIILFRAIFTIRFFFTESKFADNVSNSLYTLFTSSAEISILCLMVMLAIIYIMLQYVIFTTYIVEHRFIPHALRQYELQTNDIKVFDHYFNSNIPPFLLHSRSSPKWFRNSMVICVHIKAADTMASLLSHRDLATVMSTLGKIVLNAFEEFGFLPVSHFSGVYVGLVYRSVDGPTSKQNNESFFSSSSETESPIVKLILSLQERMEQIGRSHGFNVSLGIALNYGSTFVGFLNNQYNFEVEGRCRDMAVSMGSHNPDAIYISRAFEGTLVNQFYRYGTVNKIKVLEDNSPSAYWLKVDNSFSGMQLTDFIYVGILGKGGYGSVHLVKEKNSFVDYAVKTIQFKASSRLPKMIQRECLILQRMHHPNVVNLKCSFITNNQLYLVMDFVEGGNLKQVLERNQSSISLDQLRYWFADLVSAIDYIHKMDIIHRDVKPANCMIDNNGTLKLADFGLSKFSPHTTKHKAPFSSLGINVEELEKLKKFLPLNTHLASIAPLPDLEQKKPSITLILLQVNFSSENKSCSINFDISENLNTVPPVFAFENANSYLWDFQSFSMKVFISHSLDSAQSFIVETNVDAIFVNVFFDELNQNIQNDDISNQAISLIVKELDNAVIRTVPIFLFGVHHSLHSAFKDIGAKECFEKLAVNRFCHGVDVTNGRNNFYFVEDSHFDARKHPFSLNVICGFTSNDRELFRRLLNIRGYNYSYENNQSQVSNNNEQSLAIQERSYMQSSQLEQGGTVNNTGNVGKSIQQSNDAEENQIVGTLHFIAPEVLQYHIQTELIDWWACGITMYYCCVHENLFGGENKETIKNNIIEGPIDFSALGGPIIHSKLRKEGSKTNEPDTSLEISTGRSSYNNSNLATDSDKTINNVIGRDDKHLIDLLLKLINRDCNARIGKNFAEIESHPFFQDVFKTHNKEEKDKSDKNFRYQPKNYEPQVYSLKDKFNFFGTNNTSSSSYEFREKQSQLMMDRRNFFAMKNFELNRKKSKSISKNVRKSNNRILNDPQAIENLLTGRITPESSNFKHNYNNNSAIYMDSEIAQIQEESVEDIEKEHY